MYLVGLVVLILRFKKFSVGCLYHLFAFCNFSENKCTRVVKLLSLYMVLFIIICDTWLIFLFLLFSIIGVQRHYKYTS